AALPTLAGRGTNGGCRRSRQCQRDRDSPRRQAPRCRPRLAPPIPRLPAADRKARPWLRVGVAGCGGVGANDGPPLTQPPAPTPPSVGGPAQCSPRLRLAGDLEREPDPPMERGQRSASRQSRTVVLVDRTVHGRGNTWTSSRYESSWSATTGRSLLPSSSLGTNE